jgi:hypothetical protein
MALMELAWIGTAAFTAEGRGSAARFGKCGELGQCVGGMGGDVEHDEVGDAHDVVASGEEMRGVFRGALPIPGGKERGDATRLVPPQAENFCGDAHDAPNVGVFCSLRERGPMELSYYEGSTL